MAGEMAQQWKALAALTEDLGLVPRTIQWLTITCNSSSRGYGALFWFSGHYKLVVHIQQHVGTHTYEIKKNTFKSNKNTNFTGQVTGNWTQKNRWQDESMKCPKCNSKWLTDGSQRSIKEVCEETETV